MKKHWWKILSVLIILYTLTVGLLVPLKPGIVDVQPSNAKAGQNVTLEVKGYNTRFLQGSDNIRAWLKVDSVRAIPANNILVKGEQLAYLGFAIPSHLPIEDKVKDLTLIIDNPVDGTSILPSALFVSQQEINPAQGVRLWGTNVIEDLHEHSGMTFPFRNILAETIRNTYFHVPLWFGMILIFIAALVYSTRYLSKGRVEDDLRAVALTHAGVLFGLLGLVTGALWAKFTWGAYWSWDVKQNMSAIAMLIYMAYFVLRSSFDDREKQARIAAVYNIFAFAALIPLLFIIPRLTDSLHPGNGGNPGLGSEDLDNTMRMVFYPAIIGWTLLGVWMAQLKFRMERLKELVYERE